MCILIHAGVYDPTVKCSSRQAHHCIAGVQICLLSSWLQTVSIIAEQIT